MNDYLLGTIDCCDSLTDNTPDFIDAIKRSTGMTEEAARRLQRVNELANVKDLKAKKSKSAA